MAPPGRPHFHTTQWSLIGAAQAGDPDQAREALAELCRTYWYPLYAETRRRGHDAESAADQVQAFLALLLERDDLADLRPERGRFRAFLLASLGHFLAKDARAEARLKRGGPRPLLSLDVADGERRYLAHYADGQTPEALFDRAWALTLLEQVLGSVRADWEAKGKEVVFDALKASLMGEAPVEGYRNLAPRLGMTEGAVRTAVHRLKQQFRQRLRDAVADTTGDGAVEDEVRYLLRVLQGPTPSRSSGRL